MTSAASCNDSPATFAAGPPQVEAVDYARAPAAGQKLTRSRLVTLLRQSGRANHPALVEQILADVFVLPGVTDTNDGYDRTYSEPNPSGATGFIDVPGSRNPSTPQCPG